MTPKYIHYGNDTFHPEYMPKDAALLSPILLESSMTSFKPKGLWACRTIAQYGWKEWCEGNDYYTEDLVTKFYFDLSTEARILEIHEMSDLEPYMFDYSNTDGMSEDMVEIAKSFQRVYGNDPTVSRKPILDVLKVYENFDAMELVEPFDYKLLHVGFRLPDDIDNSFIAPLYEWNVSSPPLYGWDVPSIVIWNPDIIKPFI